MNKEISLVIIVVAATTMLLALILFVSADIDIKRFNDDIMAAKKDKVGLISTQFELEIKKLVDFMELTSGRSALIQPPSYASLISEKLRGIPEDVEAEKRQTARQILKQGSSIEYVFYAMPNGDIYLLEPYDSQIALSRLNFAFRDWYKGVTNTKETYISEVYVSATTNHNVVAAAVPLFNADSGNKTLKGIWVGALNLYDIDTRMAKLNLGNGEYIIVADHNNQIVADSRETLHKTALQTIPWNLKEESKGEVKTAVRTLDSTKMFVTFKSMPIGTHEWIVMSIQPYDQAFFSSITLQNETNTTLSAIIFISSVSGFFMVRQIKRNVTLSKKLEKANLSLTHQAEQLRQADIAKEEFSAMVTHELKTPLVPILGYCKMLKTSMLGKLNEEETDAIEVIERSAKRLEELITDIMDVHKLDINKMKFHFENLPLNEFFDNLDSNYKKILKERGIEFATKLSNKDIVIHTDKARLRQVFENLISNSIKFVAENNGLIEIGGYKEKDSLILYVKDNGIGIPKDKQDELFKKFYQVDTSERRKVGGTGLGLVISKGMIEKMGGTIWVESDGKTGTIFYLKLPLKDNP